MSARNARTRLGIALCAAFVLVVQSLASAWAAPSLSPAVDIFGNPLCITSPDETGHGPAGDHGKGSTCCTLACNAAQSPLAVPAMQAMPPPTPRLVAEPSTRIRRIVRVERPDFDPGNPRAPPRTA